MKQIPPCEQVPVGLALALMAVAVALLLAVLWPEARRLMK